MDTTDAEIIFDADGVCDHCESSTQVLPNWHPDERGQAELRQILERIKEDGTRRDFDCIIGVSGGVDSSYLTYLAVTQFNLRPLVFHVDTGWNSKESVNNVERLVDGLGIELFTEVIDWEEMRDLQLAFLKAAVPHVDTPQDHAIFASMYKFAAKRGIRYILTGANYATECIRNPVEWDGTFSLIRRSSAISTGGLDRPRSRSSPRRTSCGTSCTSRTSRASASSGRSTTFRITRTMRSPSSCNASVGSCIPQKHFESRFTAFYEGFWLYEKFGFDVRRVQLSSLILTGQMTRERAVEALKQPPMDEAAARREFQYVASKLGIDVEELKSLHAPKRSFRDYRSQAALYAGRRQGVTAARARTWREAVIGIVSYGVGNVRAFASIYDRNGLPAMIASTPEELRRATHLILPGVGAFDWAMERLERIGPAERARRAGARAPDPGVGRLCRHADDGPRKR